MCHTLILQKTPGVRTDDKEGEKWGSGGKERGKGGRQEQSIFALSLKGGFIGNGGGLKVRVAVISFMINASLVFRRKLNKHR